MEIIELHLTENLSNGTKLNKSITQLRALLRAIKEKVLPTEIVKAINQDVEELNSTSLKRDDLRKHINQSVKKILSMLKKELKVVPKKHYQHRWQGFGIYFGMEMGLLGLIIWLISDFSLSVISVFLSTGLLIGQVAGLVVGTRKDKKAQREGRQLNFE